MTQRAISLGIATLYLVLGIYYRLGPRLLIGIAYILFCLACIWFAEEMGNYIGPLRGSPVVSKSPAFLLQIIAWILLLLPTIIYVFVR